MIKVAQSLVRILGTPGPSVQRLLLLLSYLPDEVGHTSGVEIGVTICSGRGVAPKPPLPRRLSIHIVAKPSALAGTMSWYWL